MHPPLGWLAQRCRDRRRLQPVERRLEALIVAQRCAAPGEVQYLVGRRRHQARRAQARVARLDDLGSGPDQNVGVPDGGHAMFGDGLDADCNVARTEVDRRRAVGFGETEEWIGHEVLRVAGREVAGERAEQFELLAFRS